MKDDPDALGKELSFAALLLRAEDDLATTPDLLVAGSAHAAPAQAASVIKRFILTCSSRERNGMRGYECKGLKDECRR